jgi:hypothetical protein
MFHANFVVYSMLLVVPWACFAIELAEGVHTKQGSFRGTDSKLHLLVRSLACIDRDRGLTSGVEPLMVKTTVLERSESNMVWWESNSRPRFARREWASRRTPARQFSFQNETTTSITIISTSRPCRSSTLDLAGTEWTLRLCWNQRRLLQQPSRHETLSLLRHHGIALR